MRFSLLNLVSEVRSLRVRRGAHRERAYEQLERRPTKSSSRRGQCQWSLCFQMQYNWSGLNLFTYNQSKGSSIDEDRDFETLHLAWRHDGACGETQCNGGRWHYP